MSAESKPLLRVDVDPEEAKQHGWTGSDIANLIRASNQGAPLGSVEGDQGEQRYRLPRQNRDLIDIPAIELPSRLGGRFH